MKSHTRKDSAVFSIQTTFFNGHLASTLKGSCHKNSLLMLAIVLLAAVAELNTAPYTVQWENNSDSDFENNNVP